MMNFETSLSRIGVLLPVLQNAANLSPPFAKGGLRGICPRGRDGHFPAHRAQRFISPQRHREHRGGANRSRNHKISQINTRFGQPSFQLNNSGENLVPISCFIGPTYPGLPLEPSANLCVYSASSALKERPKINLHTSSGVLIRSRVILPSGFWILCI